MMDWNDGSPDWGWWAVTCVAMLLFWVVLAWAILGFRRSSEAAPRASADDVLEARFASGEIDADEFQQRRDAMEKARSRVDRKVPAGG